MMDTFASLVILGGVIFVVLAAVGILKFPDTLTRLAAGSKASTLGLMLIIFGACLHSNSEGSRLSLIASLVIVFMTSPVAAHLLGRASMHAGMKFFGATKNQKLPESFGFKSKN